MNVEESAALWRMYLQCSAIWHVSIFTDSILICPGRTFLVLRCLYPSSITNPRALFLVSRKPSSPVFDLLTLFSVMSHVSECEPPVPTLGHIWDVMLVWRKGNNEKKTVGVTVLCTITTVHKGMSSSYRLVDCIGLWFFWFSSLFSKRIRVFGLYGAICYWNSFCLHASSYHLVSWAWWDWPLT